MERNNLALSEDTIEISQTEVKQPAKVIEIAQNETKTIRKNKILYNFIKRIIDIIGALVGIIVLIPTTVAIYIARKILKEDEGPLFYEQLRYGKNGKVFRFRIRRISGYI